MWHHPGSTTWWHFSPSHESVVHVRPSSQPWGTAGVQRPFLQASGPLQGIPSSHRLPTVGCCWQQPLTQVLAVHGSAPGSQSSSMVQVGLHPALTESEPASSAFTASSASSASTAPVASTGSSASGGKPASSAASPLPSAPSLPVSAIDTSGADPKSAISKPKTLVSLAASAALPTDPPGSTDPHAPAAAAHRSVAARKAANEAAYTQAGRAIAPVSAREVADPPRRFKISPRFRSALEGGRRTEARGPMGEARADTAKTAGPSATLARSSVAGFPPFPPESALTPAPAGAAAVAAA